MAIDKNSSKNKTGQDGQPWKLVTFDGKPLDKKGGTFGGYKEANDAGKVHTRETGVGVTAVRA